MTISLLITVSACSLMQEPPGPAREAPRRDPIPLELVMSDPIWIGASPEEAFWADDGESVWYECSRAGRDGSEWVHIDLEGTMLGVLPDEEIASVRTAGLLSPSGDRRLFERDGDVFLLARPEGTERRLTRTAVRESQPRFLADPRRIVFERDGATIVRALDGGEEVQPAVFLLEDPPSEEDEGDDEPEGFLADQQARLFDLLKQTREREERANERERAAEKAREAFATPVFHMGDDYESQRAYLAPDERHVIVRLSRKGGERGRADVMPRYVTTSGYVETAEVRSKVGTDTRTSDALALIDLDGREIVPLDLAGLPGISEDPLARLRAGAPAWRAALEKGEELPPPEADPAEAEDSPRPVSISRVEWQEGGSRALVQVRSLDNKDDWLVLVDPRARTLVTLDHLHDEAWINGRFRAFGWLTGGQRLWFLSEASGWSHLTLHDAELGNTRVLTSGEWEVSSVRASRDGAWLYFLGNVTHPGEHEVWRVACDDARMEQLTALGGENDYWLAPDEDSLLVLHSASCEPPELWVQANQPLAPARRLTSTISSEFCAQPWIVPEVVPVPSRHGRPIHSRLYAPPDDGGDLRPAVLFVHGAGYLQNAHKGWSSYFREFMFHSLLAHRGYVVLDMDYRASAGYGRDWRTAIHRRMGEVELDDLEDGVGWLVAEHRVDPARVGVYGGSYGGFLVLMALFKRPELFACGAALRPVTDWAHYSDGYTANILNTPEVDPEAYWHSSPIEHAAGLQRPLLICHGMLDDNVFFADSVRLAQRLIELGKQDWELASYPMEPHSFREPASWLDEYRRILALFEQNLR